MAETFAELVKAQRGPLPGGRYRKSQHECARLCGVSPSTWKRWERGDTLPRTPEALRFAEAFDVEDELVFAAIAEQERQQAAKSKCP